MRKPSISWRVRQRAQVVLCAALLAALLAAPAAARRRGPPPARDKVATLGLKNVALRPDFLAKHRPGYRVTVPLARHDTIRDQQSSGRCWLFAAANVLSNKVAARGSKPPELSVSFLNHHALRRKAFGLLDKAVAADKPTVAKVDDLGEGGEFPYAMQLVREHGLVPESQMPSRFDADHSGVLLGQLQSLLARAAVDVGGIDAKNKSGRQAVADQYKKKVVGLLDLALGKPPEAFVVNGRRHTPASYRKALGIGDRDLRYVGLSNQPNKDKPAVEITDDTGAFKTFSTRQVKSRQLRRIAQHALDAGEALYFSANVNGANPHRVDDKRAPKGAKGILSVGAFDYRGLFGEGPLGKADRLTARVNQANHGMVLTGYDTRGKSRNVRKWRVDNSWGTDAGDGGRFHMYNDYFGAYVEKLYVPEHLVPKALRPIGE